MNKNGLSYFIGKSMKIRTVSGQSHIGKLRSVDNHGSVILENRDLIISIVGPCIESLEITHDELTDKGGQ